MSLIERAVRAAGIHNKKNYVGFDHELRRRVRAGAETDEKVIRLYVSKKVPLSALSEEDKIPATLEFLGKTFATDVIVLNPVAFQAGVNVAKVRPVRMGFSIGHYKITAGSGGFVCYANGEPRVMSNNHVFANQSSVQNVRAQQGDPIIQPGPYDGGVYSIQDASDAIGTLAEFVPLDEEYMNEVDVALAVAFESDDLPALPAKSTVGTFVTGQTASYVGRSSGAKTITVSSASSQLSVSYENFTAQFDDVAVFSPAAIGGDSGSGIVDSTGAPLGLVFAGDTTANVGIAVKMTNIVAAFKARSIDISFTAPAPGPAPPPLSTDTVTFLNWGQTTYTNGLPAETVKVSVSYPQVLDFYLWAMLKNAAGQTVDITDNHYVGFDAANQPPAVTLVFSSIGYGTYTLEMFCATDDNVPISQQVSVPFVYSAPPT